MCTATDCFKALAHCCTQQPWHLRNPIHLLHALVFSAGMSHQEFQVPNWPWSSKIVPTNDGWPPTIPGHWRPPTPPLPSPTSTSSPPVVFSGDTASQPYSGSVQDGCFFSIHDLEPDDESDSWISDDDDPPALSSHSGPHPSLIPLCCHYAHGFQQHEGLQDIYKYSTSSSLESYDFNSLLAEVCDAFEDMVSSFEEPFYQVTLHTDNIVKFIYSVLRTLFF